LIVEVGSVGAKRLPDEQVLLAKLLTNYDMAARPIYNAAKPVNVQFGISFTQICDMVKLQISFQAPKTHKIILFFFAFVFLRTNEIRF
jgi:hypothetical protein